MKRIWDETVTFIGELTITVFVAWLLGTVVKYVIGAL
jgi:hypothetical protein